MALDRFKTLIETHSENVGFSLFLSHHLGQPTQDLTRRMARRYCLNHASVSSTATPRELLDLVLGLYVARALKIKHVEDEVSRTGMASSFSIEVVTRQAEQALSLIDWPAVFHFDKITDEHLCNAIVWSHIFRRARIKSLQRHRWWVEVTLQVRRYRLYKTKAQDWKWQSHLVTHIIFTRSDWGRAQLEESHTAEFNFIIDNMPRAIAEENVHLVGEFLLCLRILDRSLDDARRATVKLAKKFLASVKLDADDNRYRAWCTLMGGACRLS